MQGSRCLESHRVQQIRRTDLNKDHRASLASRKHYKSITPSAIKRIERSLPTIRIHINQLTLKHLKGSKISNEKIQY